MEQTGVGRGLGFDNPICLEIENESTIHVHGQGRAYILNSRGPGRLEVRVLAPGETHSVGA